MVVAYIVDTKVSVGCLVTTRREVLSRSLAARCFPLRRRLSNVSGPARAACHRVPTGTGLGILGGCGRHGHGATTSPPTSPCPSSIFLQSTASLSANRHDPASTSPTPIHQPEDGGAATAMSRGCHSAARRGPSRVELTFLLRSIAILSRPNLMFFEKNLFFLPPIFSPKIIIIKFRGDRIFVI